MSSNTLFAKRKMLTSYMVSLFCLAIISNGFCSFSHDNWRFKDQIWFNTTPLGANVMGSCKDFPVLIRLDQNNFNFNKAKEKGEDIRFTDRNGRSLSYEIECWDKTNKVAEIWVKVPIVHGNAETDFIIMKSGNPTAASESNSAAVFERKNGFVSVFHLDSACSVKPCNSGCNDKCKSILATIKKIEVSRNITEKILVNSFSVFFREDGNCIKKCDRRFPFIPCEFTVSWWSLSQTNQWTFFAFVWKKNQLLCYRNGQKVSFSQALPGPSIRLEEITIADIARTPDWIKLCFENQKENQTLLGINILPVVDSDGDGAPDVIELLSGTDPHDPRSKPAIASNWLSTPNSNQTVTYDLSQYPCYHDFKTMTAKIPAGVNASPFVPIFRPPISSDSTLPPIIAPPNQVLLGIFRLNTTIATGKSLSFPFPIPDYDVAFTKEGLHLNHFNEATRAWDSVKIDSVIKNLVYGSINHNQTFYLFWDDGNRLQNNVLNDIRVYFNFQDHLGDAHHIYGHDIATIPDDSAIMSMMLALKLWESVLPEMQIRQTLNSATSNSTVNVIADKGGTYSYMTSVSYIHFDATAAFMVQSDYRNPANQFLFLTKEEQFDSLNKYNSYWRPVPSYWNPAVTVGHDLFNCPLFRGWDVTRILLHEFGHSLGLVHHTGPDNPTLGIGFGVLEPQLNPKYIYYVPTNYVIHSPTASPYNIPSTYDCVTSGVSGGSLCYNDTFERESFMTAETGIGDFAFANIIRPLDIDQLSRKIDVTTNSRYVISYPQTKRIIRMKRRDGENYFFTNDTYEAEYRLFETPRPWDQNRYFAIGLDSVIVTTFAGSGIAGDADGNGTSAQLNQPGAMCMDNSGNIFVGCAEKVRRITSLGDVTTFAITTGSEPVGPFALDNGGNIYAIKGNRILKISSTGIVSNYAGSLTGAFGYQNGVGPAALFNTPSSIALVGNNLYVSDRLNHVIRLIVPAAGGAEGNVTLFAGSPNTSGDNDGNRLTSARFNKPSAVAVDRLGLFLYVGESSFGTITGPNRIRRIEFATGTVSTIAGGLNAGYADAQGPAALFNQISELETDVSGNVYAVEWGNNTIRKISPDGFVSTIAGRPDAGVLYRDGAGSDACFSNPSDLAVDTRGSFFISDHSNNRIRKISMAVPLTITGSQIGGRLTTAVRENWFEFSIWTSGTYNIDAFPGSLTNPQFELFGPNDVYGNAIFTNLNGRSTNLIPGKYRIRISAPSAATGAYTVRLSTDFLTIGGTAKNGNIEFAGDNNWYEFEVPTGGTGSYTITTSNPSGGLHNSVGLYLYDTITAETPLQASPQSIPIHLIEKNNGAGGNMPVITVTLTALQHYWVRVRAGNPDDTGTYQLSIAP